MTFLCCAFLRCSAPPSVDCKAGSLLLIHSPIDFLPGNLLSANRYFGDGEACLDDVDGLPGRPLGPGAPVEHQ